jgi:hypothetical protein
VSNDSNLTIGKKLSSTKNQLLITQANKAVSYVRSADNNSKFIFKNIYEFIAIADHNDLMFKLENKEQDDTELTYGSFIVLNIFDKKGEPRKLTTDYRIASGVQAIKMADKDYDANSVFRVIPGTQFEMLNKVRSDIKKNEIPSNFDIDYLNFMSELQTNVEVQNKLMGEPVGYGSKFQLIQESSKRFLSIKPADIMIVKECFSSGYIDSDCFEY